MQECKDENIGIICMECYFPKYYVSQSELESFNGVSSGKYTIGLGQESMSFVTPREDICSISLTVLSNLLSKNKIPYNEIGWICVATETIIDHSKSISSMLMQLFEGKGCDNTEIEGIDVKHACYGGTFALFSAFDRISSKYWDGKYCIVIAADIAEYAQGPARCTGGVGAIALLIGRNGCIELNPLRASYKAHEYDFYKPNLNSPYPVVNGHISNECYLNALDKCYASFKAKYDQKNAIKYTPFNSDYWVFHAPYNKLISKSFGRLIYNDFMRGNTAHYYEEYKDNVDILGLFNKYSDIDISSTVNSRECIKGFEKISSLWYKEYVSASTLIPKQIGNCYTASVFMGLLSLICSVDIEHDLCGQNVSVFSYGSGTMASIYSLKIHSNKNAIKQLKQIVINNDIQNRLQERTKVNCNVFTQILNDKTKIFKPKTVINDDNFYLNTYYLSKINAQKERFYEKYDVETAINANIARNKGDNDKIFKVPNLAHFVDEKLSKCVHRIVDDSSLSKKDAIKIDDFINKSNKTVAKCSYS